MVAYDVRFPRPLTAMVGGGAALVLCVVAGACRGTPAGVVDDCDIDITLPSGVSTDILFVIDNSRSMEEEQEKVIAELSGFVQALSSGSVEHDFQVGVTTTGVSINTRLGCDPNDPTEVRAFPDESGHLQPGRDDEGNVVDPDAERIVDASDPDLLSKFGTLVRQGIAGSGQEMGLEAMRLALSGNRNAGFLRPGARLLVVIVTDEDDCSDPTGNAIVMDGSCNGGACGADLDCDAGFFCLPTPSGERACQRLTCEAGDARQRLEPVQAYVDFLNGLKDGTGANRPREVYLAVIGAVDPTDVSRPMRCSGGGTEAFGSAVRYVEAVEAMGVRGFIDSICRANYAESLDQIAALVESPHLLTIARGPADGRLIQIELTHSDGSTATCLMNDGFIYEPPTEDAPARAVMVDHCRLRAGDRVRVFLFCAD